MGMNTRTGGTVAMHEPRRGTCMLLVVSICLLQQVTAAAAQAAFLQEQLPLRVLVTTPTAVSTLSNASAAVTLTGRQALTAVFSRPVIALGSDWGSKELPASLVPFSLSCGMPGRLRWVTTNIARFDPLVEWPSDLACSFDWNKGLKSFDGAPLMLDSMYASVPLATQPLVMDVVSVASAAADNATDGLWSATLGLPDDKLPEVPPDGNITLSFSYPVELSKLASALKLVGLGASGRAITVSPCTSAAPPIFWPLIFAANGQPQAGSSPSSSSTAELLKVNSTCAVVKIVPGLAAGASAALRLPAGARYSSIAGPVSKDTDKQVYGLRAFRIPLTLDFQNITNMSQSVYNGVRFRRLTMWLPHGLAANTQLSALQPLIKICAFSSPFDEASACKDLQFELSRPSKGSLQAAVPVLGPKQHYRVIVAADAKVKDAFGLPLQASANTWWTMDLDAAYQGPNLNQVALLEVQQGNPSLPWPWVSRGTAEKGVDKVQAWDIAVPSGTAANSDMARAVAALNYGYSGLPSTAFGNPDASVSRPSSTDPAFQTLPLPGKPGISFVGSCCREVTWPTTRNVFASNLLVAQSNLQAAFVGQAGKLVAWVTSSQGASKAVAGAKVQVYLSRYSEDFASLGPSCTTSAEGICTLDVSTDTYDSATRSAVITAQGEGPLIVPNLPSGYSGSAGAYAATIVLDRQLVKPGDDLHITAYIQKRNGSRLEVAKDVTSVIIQVSPSFNPASPSDSTRITAAVNTTFGSVHATLPVPKDATPAGYTVQLFTVRKSSQDSNAVLTEVDSSVEPIAVASAAIAAMPEPAAQTVPRAAAAAVAPTFDGVVPPKLPPVPVEQPGDLLASASFTVGDPRPPTATLTVDAPAWVKPADSVTVKLTAESYIGSDVSGADITLDWESSKAKGSVTSKTNTQGVATAVIELGKLPKTNQSEPGDSLRLSVTWIGPTREAITASKTVKITDGPVRVELQRNLLTDVPGIKFGVKADAFSNDDDSPIKGAVVEVTLSAANGTASLTNCSTQQLALLTQQRCSIPAGHASAALQCQLSLPCMGEFILKGCVNGSCSEAMRIGRNASFWKASPWSAPPQLNLLPDRQNVTVGGALNLAVQNPWWGPTSALLVWGNAVKREVRVLPQIPPGPSTIAINGLGEETVSAEVVLSGPQAEGLRVAAAVEGQAKTADGLTVLAPKSGKGAIKVSVKDSAGAAVPGAEVTLLVVDKAILDLMPYALQDVSAAIAPDLSTYFTLTDLNSLRTSRAAINATFAALQRRLTKLDPWLPVDTQVTPGGFYPLASDQGSMGMAPQAAAVDVSDATYLAGFTTPITPIPYRPCAWGQTCPVPYNSRNFGLAAESVASDGVVMAAMAVPAAAPMPMMAKSAAANNAAPRTAAAAAAPANSAAGGAAAAAAPGAELRLQQAFRVTALFKTVTAGADGSVTVNFPAPESLGTFVVRAYAAAPKPASQPAAVGVVYGAAETELVVRRAVSLTPSLPRQVRAGDNFTAGVLVEAPGELSGDTSVTVTASLVTPKSSSNNSSGDGDSGSSSSSNALALTGPASVTVTLGKGKAQQEARFNFSAQGLGSQDIKFVATTGKASDVADQVQLEVPVLGKQGPVWIATSFAVRGSNSSTVANRVEGLVLPRAENGSGSVSLVTGVGYLPAVQGSYEALVRQGVNSMRNCPSGTSAIALSVLPAMLAAYRPPSTAPSSYLTPFQLNATQQALLAAVEPLTDATYGLLSVDPRCMWPSSSGPSRADVALNAWATWLVEQLADSAAPAAAGQGSKSKSKAVNAAGFIGAKEVSGPWAALVSATKTWRKALEAQVVADAVAARAAQPPMEYRDLDSLSWARLVLGASWEPSGVAAEVQKDLSMSRLVAAAVNMSVGAQARVGLALLTAGNSSSSSSGSTEAGKIAGRLLSNVRVGGRTAYVATGDGERGAAALSDQSLALMLFLRSGTDNPLIQKVAAWVGQGAAPPPFRTFGAIAISSSPWESALRGAALTSYDAATSSTIPDLALTAVAGVPAPAAAAAAAGSNKSSSGSSSSNAKLFQGPFVNLLSARFNSSNAGSIARSSTKWERIPPGSSLIFNAKGSGEVSIAASLNFTPEALLPFPTYRGLWVQRVVQLASADGGNLAGVGLGKLVTIAVQVTSPDDQSDVVVEVLMPGGLEPLDPNVYTDPELASSCSSSEDESDLSAPSSSSNGGFALGKPVAVASIGAAAAYPGMAESAPMVQLSRPGRMGISSSMPSSPYRPIPWWRPWPVCPVQTTSPASVLFSFSYFRAGTQTLRFKAVAATSGTFTLPPVKAYVQQQPEVMGLSPAGTFVVCPTAAPCAAAQQQLGSAAAAKACPKGCSGNGACNLASGVCICDGGFSGADCGTFGSSR
ncbi:hypothetical protein OEZ86_009641 [Tetradesmus obliquus]|uniref:EGF-like domain-containing protein n=1 Tax=Tetradesmus obliquus TaxID=3088 RepID=A0ABY8UPS8_TETOB|nr:hypothetical protein OEZ85_001085 [Tetradesmus obliquus]WIA43125.1 hypothetical protein OEZ86_009641 [Tetradesmus obliquus]